MRGATVEVKCKNCETPFMARVADRKRGWGKYCSKSCKAQKCVNGRRAYANHVNRDTHDVEDSFHPFDTYSLGQE